MTKATYPPALWEQLLQYGQEHLLKFWESLDSIQKQNFKRELESIDYRLLQSLYTELILKSSQSTPSEGISPLENYSPPQVTRLLEVEIEEREKWRMKGEELISSGQVACLTVAGGQGTRLGHEGPKGTYVLNTPEPTTLFSLMAKRITTLRDWIDGSLPWYIMTSPTNHTETVNYFKDQSFLGLSSKNVMFFPQAELPALDLNGKILLESPDKIALSPNGNGGVFLALKNSGALADMKRRGIEWVFFNTVDNALVKMADPTFIGFTALNKFDVSSKSVSKKHADEKVGVFANHQGKTQVIEYSDLPETLRYAQDDQNRLMYSEGNIAIHCFKLSFLEQNAESGLPYHRALKKVNTIDAQGNPFTPPEPNAYKFELFMFDIFAQAKEMGILSVVREQDFAPVKNATGEDSPESAVQLLLARDFRKSHSN